MTEEELKQVFHSFFNKINNICVAAGSNREILEDEQLDKLSGDELRERLKNLLQVLSRIEENARSLDKSLQEFYNSLQ